MTDLENIDELERVAIDVGRVFGSQARWLLASFELSDDDDRELVFDVMTRCRTADAVTGNFTSDDEELAQRLLGRGQMAPPKSSDLSAEAT